jgi:hypothetical protein
MKTFRVSVGIVGAIALVLGVGHFVIASEHQTSIVNVFSEQSQAATDLHDELQRHPSLLQTQRGLREYAQAVQAIDASSCPKDFQLAWFDYVSAVTDLSQKNLTATAIKDGLKLEASVWTKDGKLAEDVAQDLDSGDHVAECFRRCERIAISYGVSFHPVANQQQN